MAAFCGARSLTVISILAVLMFGIIFLYQFFSPSPQKPAWQENRTPQDYYVQILTWNLGGSEPTSNIKWNSLLGINSTFKPDIIVIGLQETVKIGLNFGSFIPNSKWIEEIDYEIDNQIYDKIDVVKNQAMNLIVYAKKEHLNYIEQLETLKKQTNPKIQIIEHKGGHSIRFNFYLMRLAFTNAHLDAGENEDGMESRESSYGKILEKPFKSGVLLSDCDYHFFFGDLNFRISQSKEFVNEQIESYRNALTEEERQNHLDNILKYDQLKESMKNQKALFGFNEKKISFAPTYKMLIDSNEYDFKRVPSYTDRILWRTISNHFRFVSCEKYEGKFDYQQSDHRPVIGLFSIRA